MAESSRNHSYREVTQEEERGYDEFIQRYYGREPITDIPRDDEKLVSLVNYAKRYPENWDQNSWLTTPYGIYPFVNHNQTVVEEDGEVKPRCGTRMCLAGFQAHVIDNLDPALFSSGKYSYPAWASFKLGLTYEEGTYLFFSSNFTVEDAVADILHNRMRETNLEAETESVRDRAVQS